MVDSTANFVCIGEERGDRGVAEGGVNPDCVGPGPDGVIIGVFGTGCPSFSGEGGVKVSGENVLLLSLAQVGCHLFYVVEDCAVKGSVIVGEVCGDDVQWAG